MKVLFAPEHLPIQRVKNIVPKSIFLAGSIEMGKAKPWQDWLCKELDPKKYDFIFNPRRPDWDSSWKQRESDKKFNEQVSWELTAQDIAEKIIMYFDETSKSPITLMELGLYANSGKLTVVCPEKFYRLGNVEVVCTRYNIPLYNELEVAILEAL